jgi:hypothetical protein
VVAGGWRAGDARFSTRRRHRMLYVASGCFAAPYHNIISSTMAPKSLPSDETEPKGKSSTMRRSDSESSFVSVPEDGPVKDYRDYRVRKSGLIA